MSSVERRVWGSSVASRPLNGKPENLRTISSGPKRTTSLAPRSLRNQWWMREAALLISCDVLPDQCVQLKDLSNHEWRSLLRWLDYSGLALYFLDRIVELGLADWLPAPVLARLHQSQTDNTERTHGMLAESVAIQKMFQTACLSYAVLKGVSLCPMSVPRPDLRSQFDLDFLVAESDAREATQVLVSRGYRLYATSCKSLEFKFNEKPGVTLNELYKDLSSFAVELHLESYPSEHRSLLQHAEKRDICGISMPVLSPIDLFLGQAQHAFKHVCGEFTRAAHLLEFRRHVLARYSDDVFWTDLKAVADQTPGASTALGAVTLLIASAMGEFAPESLIGWTVRQLPGSVQLWVNMYGRRAILGSIPGSKLYLLLRR